MRTRLFLVLVGGLSVLSVLASEPAGAVTYTVQASRVLNARAASSQDTSASGTTDVACGPGTFAFAANVVGGSWGTYPALEYVRLWCTTVGGSQTTASFGEAPSTALALPAMGSGRCGGSTGVLTGLRVNFDRYLKDLTARCGVLVDTTPPVSDAGFQSSWMLNRVERNDSQGDLRCDTGQVLTGLRIRYRRDRDETAFTRLQPWCAAVRRR